MALCIAWNFAKCMPLPYYEMPMKCQGRDVAKSLTLGEGGVLICWPSFAEHFDHLFNGLTPSNLWWTVWMLVRWFLQGETFAVVLCAFEYYYFVDNENLNTKFTISRPHSDFTIRGGGGGAGSTWSKFADLPGGGVWGRNDSMANWACNY